MAILDVQLIQCEHIIIFNVLAMSESLRGKGFITSIDDNKYIYAIESYSAPAIIRDTLYIRGNDKSEDLKTALYFASNPQMARDICIDIMKLVQKVNGIKKDIIETPLLCYNKYKSLITFNQKSMNVILYSY